MIEDKQDFFNYIKMVSVISLDKISDELKNDPDVIVELIKRNQILVNDFKDKLLTDKALMHRVFNEIDSTLYHRLSDDLKNNKEFMRKVVEIDPNAIYFLGENLRGDIDFKNECQVIINRDKENTVTLDTEYTRTQKEQTLQEIKGNVISFLDSEKYNKLSEELKKDPQIVNTIKLEQLKNQWEGPLIDGENVQPENYYSKRMELEKELEGPKTKTVQEEQPIIEENVVEEPKEQQETVIEEVQEQENIEPMNNEPIQMEENFVYEDFTTQKEQVLKEINRNVISFLDNEKYNKLPEELKKDPEIVNTIKLEQLRNQWEGPLIDGENIEFENYYSKRMELEQKLEEMKSDKIQDEKLEVEENIIEEPKEQEETVIEEPKEKTIVENEQDPELNSLIEQKRALEAELAKLREELQNIKVAQQTRATEEQEKDIR